MSSTLAQISASSLFGAAAGLASYPYFRDGGVQMIHKQTGFSISDKTAATASGLIASFAAPIPRTPIVKFLVTTAFIGFLGTAAYFDCKNLSQ